jgi:outer membrane protein OmpA-like peptidoglycan-associated protein
MRARSNLRITLTAYAESDSNTSPRDARRLSLTRALTVRDYLTNKGISSSRIDVRALGVNYTSGDGDRVDVTAE